MVQLSIPLKYAARCYQHWLAGGQGGARSQLAASGSVSPRQGRPEHGDRGRPTPLLSTLLGLYDQLSVSVFHVHGFS